MNIFKKSLRGFLYFVMMELLMKSLSKIVFSVYIACLLWLVLFKTSVDFSSVLGIHIQSLNLTPFTGRRGEMIENFVVFVPFGPLLSAAFKNVIFWQKICIIFVFSLAIETTQYLLAIGVSDITDIITNTFGGLVGLAAYSIGRKYIDSEKIDRVLAIFITLLIVLCLLLRFFVFKVKY